MTHIKELPADQFEAIESPLLIEDDPRYASGDSLCLTMEGHREQVTLGITKVCREKVHKGWCYLALTGIDDLKQLFQKQ
jgi:hypothetical protein